LIELLRLLQDVSPFVALAGLVYLAIQMRMKEIAATAKTVEHDALAEKYRADTERYRAEAEQRRDEREEKHEEARAAEAARRAKLDEQSALILAQTSAALVALVGTQKVQAAAITKGDRRITEQVEHSRHDIIIAIEKAQELITQALNILILREDQTDAIARIEKALQALIESDESETLTKQEPGAGDVAAGRCSCPRAARCRWIVSRTLTC